MTLNQLKVFDAVASHLNMTRASEALNITEPSVFKQVKAVEKYCGVRLYRRVGRQIELTREGRIVQADVRAVLFRVDRIRQRFKLAPRSADGGSLHVGASHGPSVAVIPFFLAAFNESHPRTQIVFRTMSSRGVEEWVAESEGAIGLITNPSKSPLLHAVPYRQENIVTVVSAKHPLAKKNEASLAEVAQGPLIIRKATEGWTSEIIKQIEHHGFQINILMECDSGEAIKTAAMKGLGLGILFEDHVQSQLKSGELKIVKVAGLKRIKSKSFIVYRKDKPLSQDALDFLALLSKTPLKLGFDRAMKRAIPTVVGAQRALNTHVIKSLMMS